jgi:hypothetical protein
MRLGHELLQCPTIKGLSLNEQASCGGRCENVPGMRALSIGVLLTRGSYFAQVNGYCIVGANDRMDDANTNGVSIFFVAECKQRSGALHEMRGNLPVIGGALSRASPARRWPRSHERGVIGCAGKSDFRNSCGVIPATCCQSSAASLSSVWPLAMPWAKRRRSKITACKVVE